MRREVGLPEDDVAFLDAQFPNRWETIRDGAAGWLLVHGLTVPPGYLTSSTSAALRIEATYPEIQIDMVYFKSHLARKDGKEIRALAYCEIDGANWQRWSRHRTGANPWRPGVDGVETHLELVKHWMEREFN